MRKAIFLSFFVLGFHAFTYAQISISCPPSVTVSYDGVEGDFTNFGEPIVTSSSPYELEKQVEALYKYDCDSIKLFRINYIANQTGTSLGASCFHEVSVLRLRISDITGPASITNFAGDISSAIPEVTGYPFPSEYFSGSNYFSTYDDVIINAGGNYSKIIRKWTILDWCTGNVLNFEQIISFNQVYGEGELKVKTCNNDYVDVMRFSFMTDQVGLEIDLSLCELIDNDLTSYMNCIVENNDFELGSTLTLILEGSDNHLQNVTSLDMVIAQRAILGISPLNNYCSLIASDVNNDGNITAVDLLLMRRLILGIDTRFQLSPSWKFYSNIPSDNVNVFPELIDLSFKIAEFPLVDLQPVAIKIGDVSGNN